MDKKIRNHVLDFYSEAATEPQGELCCPVKYETSEVAHIPKEVFEISYGCGSPVGFADLKLGETVIDLGSGGGVDVFISAKKVGEKGRVIGIDMTEAMTKKAKTSAIEVTKRLGFNNIEFKEGFLEEVPLPDNIADCVISNCVINLSPDKTKVVKEVLRLLKPNARFCFSDVLAENEVPKSMQEDKKLWGECISGALREVDFLNILKESGAYGLEIKSRELYRMVDGLRFDSVVISGYKSQKNSECTYKGHFAIYNGPFNSVIDDDGHNFPLGIPVEICTDTLAKISTPPYARFFSIIKDGKIEEVSCSPEPSPDKNKDTSGCC